MKSNVILIGMPGSGKSTCGVLAAKSLCMSFIDTDLLIQQSEGLSLQNIIEKKGAEYFETAEEKCLCSLHCNNAIISTGGSAVYYKRAMDHLKTDGIAIYLRVSLEEMLCRISNITTRGILLRNGESIEDMFREREKLYELCADYTLSCDGLSIEQTVECICRKVR